MLKGHVFNLQTFTSEAFALFIDKFLNGRSGVAKGCGLSNTANSITIADGFFVIRGRFLEVISGVTVSDITDEGFYRLICEVDLSKTNTADQLNQAEIKIISSTSAYPTLIQQDITADGTVYQYEFARFKVESGSITNFTDRRTYVDFTSVYDQIETESQAVLNEIERALQNVLDGSAYLLKTIIVTTADTDLDDYIEEGRYFFDSNYVPANIPIGVNGWLTVIKGSGKTLKQKWDRYGTSNSNDCQTFVRTRDGYGNWSEWQEYITSKGGTIDGDLEVTGDITGNISGSSGSCTRKCSNSNQIKNCKKNNFNRSSERKC